jgi:soluble lytic murein transglycosylase-like protein
VSRLALLPVALGFSLTLPARAGGEIAVMTSGKIMYVDRFERRDERITLYLTGGGEVSCRFDQVANIVPNEVLPEPVAPEQAASLPLLPRLLPLIEEVAGRHGVDPHLVAALIWVESSGDPRARSRRGARGLMQLMPQTARELGVRNPYDPAENVEGGVRYFKQLLEQHADLSLALAAYNAGPAAVARHRGVPPYRETQRYVSKILELYGRAGAAVGRRS